MARKFKRLTARTVAAASTRGLLPDGGGLYLQVSPSGAKSWVFRFMLQRKSREMGLGSLRLISLAEARDQAQRCRRLLFEGTDPIEHRRQARALRHLEVESNRTFAECAESYIAAHEAG